MRLIRTVGNEVDYGVGVVDGTAMPFATGAVASGGGVLADPTGGSAAGEAAAAAAPAVGVLGGGGVGVSVGVGGADVGVNVGVNVALGMGVNVLVSATLA